MCEVVEGGRRGGRRIPCYNTKFNIYLKLKSVRFKYHISFIFFGLTQIFSTVKLNCQRFVGFRLRSNSM